MKLVIAALALAVSAAALGQSQPTRTYPVKAVRLIVPFAPGGATDYISRLVAERLTLRTGQSFIVENRAGGGGVVGAEAAVHSAPDGYTLLIASASYAVNPALMKLSFDPVRDVEPIVNMVIAPSAFTVSASTPVSSLNELVNYAKANPGKLFYATQGVGSITHVSIEAFLASIQAKMVHVPYKGVGPALAALAAGDVQMVVVDPGVSQPLAAAGRIKILAISGNRRFEQFPNVPTATEAGFPQLAGFGSWQGMFAPKGTPAVVIDTLNRQVNAILQSKDVVDQLTSRLVSPLGGSPADFASRLGADIQRFEEIVRKLGIKAE